MPGEAVRLGPFKGGLNTLSDPTSLADSELVDCVNFEIDLDGSLVSRPPITSVGTTPAQMRLLGYFVNDNGTTYLIGSVESTTSTYYYNGTSWVLITNTIAATAMAQFAYSGITRLWLTAALASGNPSGYYTFGGAFTAVATMPKGNSILLYKNRLFVAPGKLATSLGSRLRFSSVTDPTVWNGTDFLDINPGDGQNITDMTLYFNNILIFKNDSTHTFVYDSSPDRGQVSRVSATVGASDINCVAAYENYIFTYHEGSVYELVNNNYNRINIKVPFLAENSVPGTFNTNISLSVWSDRLIVRHFDRVYVYNLRNQVWSRWWSGTHPAFIVPTPGDPTATDVKTGFATCAVNGDLNLYRIQDTFNAVNTEVINCTLRTKNYDYGASSNFKKLFWWGADVVAQGIVNVMAYPIVYSFGVTYDQMALVSYDALQTYDQPLDAVPVATDSVAAQGAGNRKFLRFLKTLRFRQIYFTATIQNDGKSSTAPSRIFNFNTYVNKKQQVSKKIS